MQVVAELSDDSIPDCLVGLLLLGLSVGDKHLLVNAQQAYSSNPLAIMRAIVIDLLHNQMGFLLT